MKRFLTIQEADRFTFETKVGELLNAGYKISSTSSSSFIDNNGDRTNWMAILIKGD